MITSSSNPKPVTSMPAFDAYADYLSGITEIRAIRSDFELDVAIQMRQHHEHLNPLFND